VLREIQSTVLGGTINVASTVGKGTTVTVSLPR